MRRTVSTLALCALFASAFAPAEAQTRRVDVVLGSVSSRRESYSADAIDRERTLATATEQQRVSLEAIIARTERETEDLMRDMLSRIGELTDRTERQIRAVLTAAQAAILDSILSEAPPRRMRRSAP